jgi:uncharacterized membrane protein
MNATLTQKLNTTGILKAGYYLFAIGFITFGILHFLYGDFITGRAPAWPFNSWKLVWAYFSGTLFIITGILIALEKRARTVIIFSAAIVLLWAVLRHIPILIDVNFQWGGEIISGGKALTLFGGLLAIAGSLPREEGWPSAKFTSLINLTTPYILIGRYCLGIFLIICGIEHFIFLEFVKTLVPAWIPGNAFWTYFTGVALVAGGLGLLIPKTAHLAALLTGMMIFIWFAILHIPRALEQNDQNEWTAVVEALTFSGIAFVLAGAMKFVRRTPSEKL